ncbi:MAG: DUF302 domain-containing protein [Methylococcales bacterium]
MIHKVISKLIVLLAFVPALVFSAPGIDSIVLEDVSDVPGAVAELTAKLEEQGFTIPLTINHSGAAASVGLELDPNQVIYARPKRRLEKQLLLKSHTIGLDLPLKFHLFEDKDGIKLAVNSIGYLIDRHQLSINDFVLRITDRLTEQFGTVADTGVVTVQSSRSVDETVQALQDAIVVNPDARIPLVLNYADRRENSTSQELRKNRSGNKNRSRLSSVLIVFGNPKVGTPLMQANPEIGIDLPLEFLVWKSRDGQVNISYNNPQFIAKRFDLQGQDARIEGISNALKALSAQAAGQD